MDKQAQQFPAVAKVLGYAGIIPFVAIAISLVAGSDLSVLWITDPVRSLLGYAAVIISFIGAVHWGVAMQSVGHRQNLLFTYSVLPALLAWVWLLVDAKIALIGMGLTIVAMLFIDRWLLSGIVPQAYLKMRLHLTIIVATCLFLAAFRVQGIY